MEPTGQKIRRIGKQIGTETIAKTAGASPAVAGGEMGAQIGAAVGGPFAPATALVGGVAGAAIGGFSGPATEYYARKAMGQHVRPPNMDDAIKSSVMNAYWGMLGPVAATVAGKGGAEAVAPEMEKVPRTRANLQQALKNRDVWHELGMSDEQIDAMRDSPELQQEWLDNVSQAEKYKGAWQTTLNQTRSDFNTRYEEVGTKWDAPADAQGLAAKMREAAQTENIRPGFKNWLEAKVNEITGEGADVTKDPGVQAQIEAQQKGITDNTQLRKIAQEAREKAKTGPSFSARDAKELRTELRYKLPKSANNFEQQAYNQVFDTATQSYQKALDDAGATPEQMSRIKGLDQEWKMMQDTIYAFDPRDENYGLKAAQALFDPMIKGHPEDAVNLIRLAQRAEDIHPGQVMPQIKEAFLQKLFNESATGNAPVEEMRALQTAQRQWGGEKGTQQVVRALFGDNSPLSDPVTMARYLGTQPEAVVQGIAKSGSALSMRSWQRYALRAGVLFGGYGALTGGRFFGDLSKGKPEALLMLGGIFAAPWFGDKVMAYGSPKVQNAYVNFRLNPSLDTMEQFSRVAGGAAGSYGTRLEEQPETNPNPLPGTEVAGARP